MLPFLKHRQEGGTSGPVEKVERKPDDGAGMDMLDAVAGDMITAIEKKDQVLLKSALEAFAEHLQDMDQKQDTQSMEGMSDDNQ